MKCEWGDCWVGLTRTKQRGKTGNFLRLLCCQGSHSWAWKGPCSLSPKVHTLFHTHFRYGCRGEWTGRASQKTKSRSGSSGGLSQRAEAGTRHRMPPLPGPRGSHSCPAGFIISRRLWLLPVSCSSECEFVLFYFFILVCFILLFFK